MSRPRRVLAGLVAAVLVGGCMLVGSVLLVGLWLSHPANTAVGPVPAALAGARPVLFPSATGEAVHGWFMPGQPGAGAVLLAHGVRASRLEMVPRARVLHGAGFAVLLFDLQAHGESPGRRITFGAREAEDVAAAAAFVRAQAPGERVGIVGASLGGAAAVLAPGPRFDAVVLEAVFATIDQALVNRLRENLPPPLSLAAPLLGAVFKLLMPWVIDVPPASLRPIDRIGDLGAPLLLLSGTRDSYTPISEARALFDAAREPKQFHAVEGAPHRDLEQFDPDAYWKVVLPFLVARLR